MEITETVPIHVLIKCNSIDLALFDNVNICLSILNRYIVLWTCITVCSNGMTNIRALNN